MREYVCPGCAALLDVEIAIEGTPTEDDVRPDFWIANGSARARESAETPRAGGSRRNARSPE
jgi:hypothetical protein